MAEVRHWLLDVDVDHTFRLEPLLRSVFFWLLTPEELADYLEREAAFYHGLAQSYRKLAAAKDNGEFGYTPQVAALRVTAEAGVRITEALGDWAEWAAVRRPEPR
jgi:hypothetical protein